MKNKLRKIADFFDSFFSQIVFNNSNPFGLYLDGFKPREMWPDLLACK
jgi:hypothetical protein